MPEDNLHTLKYRILRYMPNVVRDEWINIGVILEDAAGQRRAARTIEETAEFARVKRLHPAFDESLLRALPAEMDARVAGAADAAAYLAKLDDSLSNALQFSPQRALLAEDFDAELERLYREHVAPPHFAGRAGVLENMRAWLRSKLSDVFRRHRILARMERSVRVEEFTQPGDPMRLDYGYGSNGTRGYIQAFSLARDASQAKVLAYTAECIRARVPKTEFTAFTEAEPARENPRHQFVARLFEEQKIAVVPVNRIEKFAEELRMRVN
ncbi:MAG: DUF3037 domain-containing protein [Candidatus Acidiferrales bacterium]